MLGSCACELVELGGTALTKAAKMHIIRG